MSFLNKTSDIQMFSLLNFNNIALITLSQINIYVIDFLLYLLYKTNRKTISKIPI